MSTRTPIGTDPTSLFSVHDLRVGSVVNGNIIEAKIAVRGSGITYRARTQATPSKRIVIKVLPAVHAWTRSLALQALADACVVDALDHPGIARVLDCGLLEDQRPWLSMELVDGMSLAMLLESGRIDPVEVATIVRDVANVLDHAHRNDVVYGRLDPSAIIVPDNRPFPICLDDWTEAFTAGATRPLLQATPYHAPELRDRLAVDGKIDIYALGAIAHLALFGAAYDPAVPMPTRATTPPLLAALIRRLLAPDPTHRPCADEVRVAADIMLADLYAPAPDDAIPEWSAELLDTDGIEVIDVEPWQPAHRRLDTERDTDGVVDVDLSSFDSVPIEIHDSPLRYARNISSDDASSVAGEIDET